MGGNQMSKLRKPLMRTAVLSTPPTVCFHDAINKAMLNNFNYNQWNRACYHPIWKIHPIKCWHGPDFYALSAFGCSCYADDIGFHWLKMNLVCAAVRPYYLTLMLLIVFVVCAANPDSRLRWADCQVLGGIDWQLPASSWRGTRGGATEDTYFPLPSYQPEPA